MQTFKVQQERINYDTEKNGILLVIEYNAPYIEFNRHNPDDYKVSPTHFDVIRGGEVVHKSLKINDYFNDHYTDLGKIYFEEITEESIIVGDEIRLVPSTEMFFRQTSNFRKASSH